MPELSPALTAVLEWMLRLARSPGIEVNFCGKGAPNRLWFWPEAKYKALPEADKRFIREHRSEIKELVRMGLAPRLDDVANERQLAEQAALACRYCGGRLCVGRDHPAFETLHNSDPEVVSRRHREATKVMYAQLGIPAFLLGKD